MELGSCGSRSGQGVFVPPEAFKSKRAHVVILNDVAWAIIEDNMATIHLGFPSSGQAG